MEHLPPTGWGDVARRSDLDHLERILHVEMVSMETRLAAKFDSFGGDLRAEMAKRNRHAAALIAMRSGRSPAAGRTRAD